LVIQIAPYRADFYTCHLVSIPAHPGTEITANFSEDGTLSVSAGCNNYSATYEVDEDNISIGPAVATRMFCQEPEGIMEQEVQYLAALETAATYLIEVDKMEMRTAEGALAATFQAAGE
jgi:heat shock protein HslJ